MTADYSIENAIQSNIDSYKKSLVYTWKKFDLENYKKIYRSYRYGTKEFSTINTIDLAATLQNINADCITFDSHHWVLLTSLGILAKEGLIDLALNIIPGSDITKPDCIPRIYNLTPVDDPYWSIPTFLAGKTGLKDIPEPMWFYKVGNRFIKELYARTHSDSMESLLAKADNDWFKIWHTEKWLTEEEYANRPDPGLTVWAYPEITEDVVVINDGTKPLEF